MSEKKYPLDKLRKAWGAGRMSLDQERPKLYAYSVNDQGYTEFMGEVVHETPESVRVECYDAIMMFFGVLYLSGALEDIPRERVRLFNDRDSMVAEAERKAFKG